MWRSRGAATATGGRWDSVQREQGSFEAAGGHNVGFVADLQLEGGRGAGQNFIRAGVGGGERWLGFIVANEHHAGMKKGRRQGGRLGGCGSGVMASGRRRAGVHEVAKRFYEGGDRRRVGGDHQLAR
jgi:hypothetical protein